EPASPVRDVSEGEACPTESGFIADQDRATIAKSSTLPHDSHTISELTALCTSLQRQYSELQAKFQAQKEEILKLKERVKVLEDREDVAATQSGNDAPIKGMSINEREAAAERIMVPFPLLVPLLLSFPLAVKARIAQSFTLPTVADEPASPVRDVSEGEACPTDSSFIADQDRATIAKPSTLPHDSAPRVTSPAADEGSMQHNIPELTALCTSLQRQYSELLAKFQAQEEEIDKLKDRVKVLEDKEDVAVTQSRDDAPFKGRSINEGEAAAKRISNDSEEVARVLTSMDAAT
nr:hypothetical protein [Tanacetum cinerariifolium]